MVRHGVAALAAAALCLTGPVAAAPAVSADDSGSPPTEPPGNGAATGPLRQWAVSGTPVTSGTTRDDAPEVQPGQYTETFAPDSTVHYYRLHRARGSTVYFSAAGRPGHGSGDDSGSESVELTLGLPDGTECATASDQRYHSDASDPALIASVVLDGNAVERSSGLAEECQSATTVIASVQRDATGGRPMPAELLYIAEPPIRTSPLPDAATGAALDAFRAPSSGRTTPIRGSGAFSGAPTLTTGSYRDAIRIGEQVFYRVRVGFGQRAAFTVEVPRNGSGFRAKQTYRVDLDTYGPDRSELSSSSADLASSTTVYESSEPVDPETIGQFTAPVRYLNRDDGDSDLSRDLGPTQVERTALAGYVTFSVRVSAPGGDVRPGGVAALPVRLSVQVKGTASQGPRYEGQHVVAPGLAPDATSEQSDGPDPVLLVLVVAGVVLVVLVAGSVVLSQKRRRAHPR